MPRIARSTGDSVRPGANHDEHLRDRCRSSADALVPGRGSIPQFEHLPEHCHPAARQPREEIERGDHRRRRRVVGIVDDHDPARPDQRASVGGRPAGRECLGDPLRGNAGCDPDRGSRKGVVDGKPPKGGDRHLPARSVGHQAEAHTVGARGLDVIRSHGCVRREAVGDDASRCPVGHAADALVVGVEDRDPVGRERLDQLAFRLLDRLDRPDPRQVDRLDGRDHADLRSCDPGQLGDLAADVHAHLEDGGLMVGAQAHDRQRQSDLVVLVALVLEGHELGSRGPSPSLPSPTSSRCSRSRRRRGGRTGPARLRRSRGSRAARPGPRRPSPRPRRGRSPSGDRETRIAVAPRAIASPAKAWPSVRSPGRATKRLPDTTSRESTAAPRTGRADRARSRPPVAPARSSAVSPRSAASLPGGCDAGSVTNSSVAYEVVTGRRPSVRSGPAAPAADRAG